MHMLFQHECCFNTRMFLQHMNAVPTHTIVYVYNVLDEGVNPLFLAGNGQYEVIMKLLCCFSLTRCFKKIHCSNYYFSNSDLLFQLLCYLNTLGEIFSLFLLTQSVSCY